MSSKVSGCEGMLVYSSALLFYDKDEHYNNGRSYYVCNKNIWLIPAGLHSSYAAATLNVIEETLMCWLAELSHHSCLKKLLKSQH